MKDATRYFIGAALLTVLAAMIIWRLAGGSDSDWVVGLITAAPALAAAVGLAVVGRLRSKQPRG